MMSRVLLVFFLTRFLFLSAQIVDDEPWDIDGPCQGVVQKAALAQAAMAKCATNYSTPPKVCTNCYREFIALKKMEFDMKRETSTRTRDNSTCAQAFYSNYPVSYGEEIAQALTQRIWEKSRCHSCLNITWDHEHNASVEYLNRTLVFENKMTDWRICVINFTHGAVHSNETICTTCKGFFNVLFDYYWEIYVNPEVEFCVDVESTMNDTMHMWNDVWNCSERQDKKRDSTPLIFVTVLLGAFVILFHVASYIQTEQRQRALVNYSRLEAPPQRSRLISSSSSAMFFAQHPALASAQSGAASSSGTSTQNR